MRAVLLPLLGRECASRYSFRSGTLRVPSLFPEARACRACTHSEQAPCSKHVIMTLLQLNVLCRPPEGTVRDPSLLPGPRPAAHANISLSRAAKYIRTVHRNSRANAAHSRSNEMPSSAQPSPDAQPTSPGPLHFEISRVYQSTSKARLEVLQNLRLP